MARPPKKDDGKLSAVVRFRCTETEKQTIQTAAQKTGQTISEYVRHMALHGNITIKQDLVELETAQQLRKIGVNLNQLTKAYNSTGTPPKQLEQTWSKLEQAIDKLLSE